MPNVTLAEAQARLPELIEQLIPGEELWILLDDRPIAKLVSFPKPLTEPRKPGSAAGQGHWMSPDFDKYMELRESEE